MAPKKKGASSRNNNTTKNRPDDTQPSCQSKQSQPAGNIPTIGGQPIATVASPSSSTSISNPNPPATTNPSIPILSNTPATPTRGSVAMEGVANPNGILGSGLVVPHQNQSNHPHLAHPINISAVAGAPAPAPAPENNETTPQEILAPAESIDSASPEDTESQAPGTSDPNEYAIDSQSEDSGSHNISSWKLDNRSLKPAPLFVRPAAALTASSELQSILSPVNSPSAEVVPLFSIPPPPLTDDVAATKATIHSGNVFSDSGSEISQPAEIFSDHEEGELAEVAHATTPNTTFSPLSTRRDFHPTISPTPAPTSAPTQAPEEADNAAPIHPNPYFNAADNRDGNLLYPEPEDPRDRAVVMPMDPNAVIALHRHRSDRTNIENAKFAAELARRNPPSNLDNLLRHFKPKEISEFQGYAEDNPNSECVKIEMKALEAALEKEREQMVEYLQLVNANREFAERMAMCDQEMKRAIEDAARQRRVGQYSEENMENAVLVERNKRRGVEARLKQMEKTAELVEFTDNKYAQEHIRTLDAEQRVREDRDVIHDLRTQVKEKDAEIWKLLGEKGHLISTEQCVDFNAKVLRGYQDEIISLQTQLGESQSKVDDLYSALESGKARLGASSYSNVSDTNGHLMTEEQREKRWETAIETLRTDNEALSHQLENAQETIRLYHEATSETPEGGVPYGAHLIRLRNVKEALRSYQERKSLSEHGEAPYNDLSVHEQLAQLRDLAARNDALIETQQQLLMRQGALGGDSVSSEDIEREYKKLRTEIWAKNKGFAEQAAYAESLESERIDLLRSQEVLKQINDELRTELATMKSKLKEIKSDRDALKEELRSQDGPSSVLAPKVYRGGSYGDPKIVECLERNREYERTIMSLNKEIEVYATKYARTQAEIVELQVLIEDLHLKIAVGNNNCEEATKHLEVKIPALDEAKADRERQIQRHARDIKELENAKSDAGESPVSPRQSFFRSRSEIPATLDAIDVALLRCEIQLGQVQARRRRWGFMEGDASNTIEIAMEAQGMAEQLDDPKSIGRASFWRGVSEFMTGNSTAAEAYFETSTSYHWTQNGEERELLQEWWNVSKTALVDKTAISALK